MTYAIMIIRSITLTCGLWVICITPGNVQEQSETNAFLSTAMIYVKDWDASLSFYTGYLGYTVTGESEVTDNKTKDSLGMEHSSTGRFAFLAPKQEYLRKNHIGKNGNIGIIEVRSDKLIEYERMMNSIRAVKGEVLMVFEVDDIDKIWKMMTSGGIQVVSELSVSESGRSRAFAVIDPNGLRVELLELLTETID